MELIENSSDVAKLLKIPRNYISDLEAQVARLSKENQELHTQTQPTPAISSGLYTSLETSSPVIRELSSTPTDGIATSAEDSGHLQDLVTSVRNTIVEPSKQPRFLGAS